MNVMKWFTKKAAPRTAKRPSKLRQFFASSPYGLAGAKRDRMTEDWAPPKMAPSAVHRMDGENLRNRARDLDDNNPFAKGGIDAWVENVIECGITPKPKLPAEQRAQWKAAWDHWSGDTGVGFITGTPRECDITGMSTFDELAALWFREVLVGGGCLTHYRIQRPSRDRRLPLSINLIPEEQFADDKDDFIQFNNRQKSRNTITRGVELQSGTGRPVKYWIRQPVVTSDFDTTLEPIALPASQCEYAFFRKRVGQYRGYSILHAAIIWLWRLGYYTDNEMQASTIKSCYAAIVQYAEGDYPDDGGSLVDSDTSAVTDMDGNKVTTLQPASILQMRAPGTVTGVGPNVPPSDSIAWLMFIQRAITLAINLSYESASRDFTKGNFSQIRAAMNADQKGYRRGQKFTIKKFCLPAYGRFAQWATMRGIEGFPSMSEFTSNIEQWLAVDWSTPGWKSVNEWDDARANDLKLRNRTTTRQRIVGEDGGGDWEAVVEQTAVEEETLENNDMDPFHESSAVEAADTTENGLNNED